MAFLSAQYLHDIFVSYSHVNISGGDLVMKEWSKALAAKLEEELRIEPGLGAVSVFLDEDTRPDRSVDPTLPVTDQLQESIEKSAILAIFMSPHYLSSEWCSKERTWWENKHGAFASGEGRVFVVRVLPTVEKEWPEFFKDQSGTPAEGFFFHPRQAGAALVRPFGWRGQVSDDFTEALLDLAGRLRLRLMDMKSKLAAKLEAKEAQERLGKPSGQALYLFGRETYADRFLETRDALLEKGYAVIPTRPSRVTSDIGAEKAQSLERLKGLQACDALLVVSGDDDETFDSDLVVVGAQCRRLEAGLRPRLKPCALVDRVGPPVMNTARATLARNLGIDWIDATGAAWPTRVADWLGEASAQGGASG